MSDQSSFDLSSAAAMLVVIVVMLFVTMQLIPFLATTLYTLAPAALILWFIVMVLRGIVRGLLP